MSWSGALLGFGAALALLGLGIMLGVLAQNSRREVKNLAGNIGVGGMFFTIGVTLIGATAGSIS